MAGLRLGEALAMSADNLDSRNSQYNVTETTRAGRFGPPKNGKRLIDLDEALVDKLEVHIKKMRKEDWLKLSCLAGTSFPGSRSACSGLARPPMAGFAIPTISGILTRPCF